MMSLRRSGGLLLMRRRLSSGGQSVEVTASNFEANVLKSRLPVVLDCYATWCKPCRQLTPLLSEAVGATKGRVVLAMLDTDKEAGITESLQIKSLPTVFGVVGGRVADHFVGGQSAEFVKQFVGRLAAASPVQDTTENESSAKRILAKAKELLTKGDHVGADALLEAEYNRLETEASSTKRRGLSKLFDEKQPIANEAAWIIEARARCALAAEDLQTAHSAFTALRDPKRSAVIDKDLELKAAVATLDLALQSLSKNDTDHDTSTTAFEEDLARLRALFAAPHDTKDKLAALDQAMDLLLENSDDPERKEEARALILVFIDAIQATNPPSATAARKRLANILFR